MADSFCNWWILEAALSTPQYMFERVRCMGSYSQNRSPTSPHIYLIWTLIVLHQAMFHLAYLISTSGGRVQQTCVDSLGVLIGLRAFVICHTLASDDKVRKSLLYPIAVEHVLLPAHNRSFLSFSSSELEQQVFFDKKERGQNLAEKTHLAVSSYSTRTGSLSPTWNWGQKPWNN